MVCVDPPFICFRNQRRVYDPVALSARSLALRSDADRYLEHLCRERGRFYQNFIADQPIPVDLLNKTLMVDWKDTALRVASERLSTVLAVRHEDKHLLVHRSGQYLDELCIRSPLFLRRQGMKHQPAFAINIGHGSPIRQVASAGWSDFNSRTNVLAVTLAELVLLSTARASEVGHTARSPHDHLLDPLQKWQLPEQIVDLAGSAGLHGLCLGRSGAVYRWTPAEGVRRAADGAADDSDSDAATDSSRSISTSSHPQLAYLSSSRGLQRLDLRSGRWDLLLAPSAYGACLTATECFSRPHELLLSCPTAAVLVDVRHTGRCLQRLPSQGHHHLLQQQQLIADSDTDLVLGYSPQGAAVAVHDLHPPRGSSGMMMHACVVAASPFPAHARRRWGAGSVPMLSAAEGIAGAALVPLHPAGGARDNALLVQQTPAGDVAVQAVWLAGLSRGLGLGLGMPYGGPAQLLQGQGPLGTHTAIADDDPMDSIRPRHCDGADGDGDGVDDRQAKSMRGLLAVRPTTALDRRPSALCPLSSSAYLPCTPEEALRRFDALQLRPLCLRGDDRLRLPAERKEVDEEVLRHLLLGDLLSHLRGCSHPLSLWEVVQWVQAAGYQRPAASLLRRCLLAVHEISEQCLPYRALIARRGAYGDGLMVSRAQQEELGQVEDEEVQANYGCACAEDAEGCCSQRDCCRLHLLVYSCANTSAAAVLGSTQGNIVSRELCDLLSMEWDMEDS